MLLLLALAACGNDLSNAIFDDDASFLHALPTAEHLALSYPVPAGGLAAEDQLADLYELTVGTLTVGGAVLDLATSASTQVVELPPTERGEDYRVWGPGPYDPAPDWFLRVEMSRSSTGATYSYAFQLAETSAGPWFEYLEGSHDAGPQTVALGQGAIVYQDLESEAVVWIDYDLREQRVISAEVEDLDLGTGATDQAWTWTEGEEGEASLLYQQPAEGTTADWGDTADELTVYSRWTAEGAGRGEATLSGLDLGSSTWQLHQCWAADGGVAWSWDSQGWTEELGEREGCAL